MWVFVWKAGEKRNASAMAFSGIHEAWEEFSNRMVKDFPDIIIHIREDMLIEDYTWKGFVDYYSPPKSENQ